MGGGVPKHHILNSNIWRNGLDYAVYMNTGLY
jgi:deoxyhypusine synthase